HLLRHLPGEQSLAPQPYRSIALRISVWEGALATGRAVRMQGEAPARAGEPAPVGEESIPMRVRGEFFWSALVAASLVTPALAQAPAPPGGGGGGGFQPSPEMQKFREQHKYHIKLQTMIGRGIPELEKDKSTAITPAQAKSLLGILKPWETKDKMTPDQA